MESQKMVRSLNRKLSALALCGTALVAGVAAVYSKPGGAEVETVEPAAPPVEVTLAAVTSGRLEEPVRLMGEVQAMRLARVRAEASGRVLEMPWRLGQRVEAGAVLARIDGSKNALAIRQARARALQAQIAFEQAGRKRARTQSLFDGGETSVERYEDSVFAYRRSEAELELRRAELAALERLAEDHVMTAPFEADISEIAIEEGDFVSSGAHAFSLVSTEAMKVSFKVPAEHVASFERGDSYAVEVPVLGRRFDATIAAIASAADERSRTFEMELDLAPSAGLRTGMIASLSARLETGGTGLFVPSAAVVEKFGGSYVYVYDAGSVRQIQVRIEQRDAQRVALAGDLAPGDSVITSGQHRLEPGAAVVASSATTERAEMAANARAARAVAE